MSNLDENFKSFDMCPDCKGSGDYVGFTSIDFCSNCEGAGWVEKGSGLSLEQAKKNIEKLETLKYFFY